jgi:TolA-binding protein
MAFTFTQGLTPQGTGQQQGAAGTADMILKAGTLMQQKRNQAYARYSQARNIMRDDLKQIAGFDNTVGGLGQFSEALNALAEDASRQIREANDSIEAQEIIANFREQYNMVKAREESIAEKKDLYEKTSTASGSQINDLNQGLDVDSQYVIPEVSGVANAQNAWDNPYLESIQVIDGRLMAVDPIDGILKEIGDIEATLNSSMFDLQTEQITAGSVSDWATTSAIKTKIGLKDGSWSTDRAGQLYDDAIDDVGRTENREDSGEWHRRQVLNTLESRGLIDAFTADERRAFINGEFI